MANIQRSENIKFQFRCRTSHLLSANQALRKHPDRKQRMIALAKAGFKQLTELRLLTINTPIVHRLLKQFDWKNRVFCIDSERSVKITEEDVGKVYGLPVGGEEIVFENGGKAVSKNANNFGLNLGLEPSAKNCVSVGEIEDRLLNFEGDSHTFAILYILLAIGTLLAPKNSRKINLTHYTQYLEDVEKISSYNWGRHVVEFLNAGATFFAKKAKKKHAS